jgi:MFS family permease
MSSPPGADADTTPEAGTTPGAAPGPAPVGAPASSVRGELFGPRTRATTIGVLLLISMVAFEAMGVGTAMPALVADLGALSLYAWPFVTFMAASVFGTAMGGRWCDAAGPRGPLLVSPLLFAAGLLVAGSAFGMPQLLVGRALQGLGAGATTVAIYVLIALVYPQRVRPAVFGLMSGAWVLPALIGPPVAGLVTERFSWHWVFLGLIPVALLALALVVPAVRRRSSPPSRDLEPGGPAGDPEPGGLPSRDGEPGAGWRGMSSPDGAEPHGGSPAGGPQPGAKPRGGLVPAALGAALGVAGLSWAGQRPGAVAAGVLVAALVVLVPAMRRLLPSGVFRAARGVPTAVAARGLLAGAFFTANAFLPLMLTASHGWSLTMAGIPLVVAALGWSSASAWQGRHPDVPRPRLLRLGFTFVLTGMVGLLVVATGWPPAWLAVPVWGVAGVGMGLGFSAVSFLLLKLSPATEVGFNSSAAQMADQLTTATMIGAGGALLALLAVPAHALPVLLAVLVVLAGCGVAVAGRTA